MNSKFNKILLSQKNKYKRVIADSTGSDFLDSVASLLKAGADIIELNNGNLTSAQFFEVAMKVRELCAIFSALLVVADRIDIAMMINADGVFLNENSVDIKSAKLLTGNTMLMGSFCESENNIEFLKKSCVDYIVAPELFKNTDIRVFVDCEI